MSSGSGFHQSAAWKRIRAAFLKTQPQPYTCGYCDKTDLAGTDLQVDHIDPGHLGGGEFEYNNDFSNLIVSCGECNGRKSDRVTTTKLTRKNWKSDKWYTA